MSAYPGDLCQSLKPGSGYGSTGDAFHLTAPAPEGEGAARSMKAALEDGGMGVDGIDYINAHGTSTNLNDKLETAAIKSVFGDRAYKIPVSSTKSMIVTALAVREGRIPPTVNLENPDPECDLDYVPGRSPRQVSVGAALTNSLGFGGHNVTLALKRYSS